jgi:hypothetical protein
MEVGSCAHGKQIVAGSVVLIGDELVVELRLEDVRRDGPKQQLSGTPLRALNVIFLIQMILGWKILPHHALVLLP